MDSKLYEGSTQNQHILKAAKDAFTCNDVNFTKCYFVTKIVLTYCEKKMFLQITRATY